MLVADEAPMDANDLDAMLKQLSATFSHDHFEEKSLHGKRAIMTFQKAHADGWTKPEFRRRLDTFLRTQKFLTWTVADFFECSRAHVYPYSWYCQQVAPPTGTAANEPLIGKYRIPGVDKPVFGWKAEVGDRLAVWEPENVAPQLPPPRESLSAETQTMIEVTRENLRLRADLEDANSQISALTRSLRSRSVQIEDLESRLSAALVDLAEARSEMEQSNDINNTSNGADTAPF